MKTPVVSTPPTGTVGIAAQDAPAGGVWRPTRVRYRVMAAACALAIVTYVLRVGFAPAASAIKQEFGLNSQHLAWLMAAFLLAYACFEAPAGWIADRLGVRHFLAFIVAGAALATGLLAVVTGLPAVFALQFGLLLVLRFSFGMLQAGVFPSVARMLTDWTPLGRRAAAQGFIWMSARFGGAMAPLLFALLSDYFPWQGSVTLLSALGLLWCAAFWPWFRDRPELLPAVNAAERELIQAGKPPRAARRPHLPLVRLVKSRSVWGLCLMYAFGGVGSTFFITMLPDYLQTCRGLSTREIKWLTSLPLACGMAACVGGGFLSDALVRATGSRKWGRRLNGVIGLSCAGLALLATLWVDDVWALGALLCLAFSANDLNMAPSWASCADIGERYAGTVGGTMNMVGNLLPFVATIGIGHLISSESAWTLAGVTIMGKDLVFVMFAGFYGIAAMCWLLVDATRPIVVEES